MSTKIVCSNCDFATYRPEGPTFINYILNDGTEFKTAPAHGWCYECGTYSMIEDMNPDSLGKRLFLNTLRRSEGLFRFRSWTTLFFRPLHSWKNYKDARDELKWIDTSIERLHNLLLIAGQRESPPRCLSCWSVRTASVTFVPIAASFSVAYDFRHDCGGLLRAVDEEPSLFITARTQILVVNSEGNLLRNEFE